MAKVRIYQKTAGIPVNTSVFAVEILQNNIWYTRKVSWETIKGLIAGAESLVFENGILTFTTPDGIEHPVLSVDSDVTPNSSNPVSGGAVNAALAGKQNTLTFDQVPTDGSTNPVESNGIFDALAGKQNTLTFDNAPTDGSTNPVTSQGIYAAISAAISGIDWKQAVATYADIATTYPNPEDGWTVTTLDDDHTYRYNGTEWVDQFSLITLATSTKDGLMSSGNFSKLEGIEAQANKTVVSDTLTPSTATKKLATVSGGGSSKDILGDDAEAVVEELYAAETVTGNPLTFKSITGGKATACKVTMNPIQDLHGYSYPWAPGAGKNRFDNRTALLNVPFNSTGGNGNTNNARRITPLYISVTAGDTYTISASGSFQGYGWVYDNNQQSTADGQLSTFQDLPVTVTIPEGYSYLRFAFRKANNTTFTTEEAETLQNSLQVEAGSTATDYAPYSNICPITGRDSAKVTRTGKNVWGGTAVRDGILNAMSSATSTDDTVTFAASQPNTLAFSDGVKFKANTVYTLIFSGVNSTANRTNLRVFYTDGTYDAFGNFGTSKSTLVVTTNANKSVDRVTKLNSGGNTTLYFKECGIFEGTLTASDFEPYQGETHTHTYASPVIGGVDDFVSGEGSETYGIADLGSVTWTKQEAGGRWYFFTYVSNFTNCKTYSSPRTQPLMCSQYRNFHNGEPYADLPEGAIYNAAINNTPIIAIIDTRYTDANDFKTAMSGVQLCYELATPTDITNDPEDVTLLKGVNVLSTDVDNIELTAAKIQEATGGGAGGVDYSTAEQNTGIKWIDGKDVYQKTFVNTDLQHDSNYQGAFLLGQMPSGYDRIIGYEGIAEGTTAAVRQFVGFNGINDVSGWNCGFHITDGAILIYPAQGTPSQMSSLEGGWAAVTIKYTKA